MLRFSNSAGVATGAKNIPFISTRKNVKGVLVRFVGTNKTGQTLGLSHFTQPFVIRKNGIPIVNVDPASLKKMNNLAFGTVLFSSAQGSSFDLNFYIPFFNPFVNEKNAITLHDTDDIYVQQLPSSVVENDATCEVYIDEEDLPTLYTPYLITRTHTLSEQEAIRISDKNIYLLMFREPTTAPSKILLTRNGELVFDIPYSVAEIHTNMISRIESGTEDFVVLLLGENFANVRGYSYALQMVGGSGTLYYTTFSIDYVATEVGTTVPFPGRQIQGPAIKLPVGTAVLPGIPQT